MPKSSKKNIELNTNKPFDFVLFITVLILLSIGIVMVLSASSPSALSKLGNSYAYVTRQAMFAVLGIIILLVISKIDYRIWAKFANIAYWASILVLLTVAIPSLGSESKGATRWLDLGFTTIQPSELAKIALIIFYATWLTKNKNKLKNVKTGFFIPILYFAPIALILVFLQDHLSVTLVIMMVISIMMIMAGTKLSYFLTFRIVRNNRSRTWNVYHCKNYWKRSIQIRKNNNILKSME